MTKVFNTHIEAARYLLEKPEENKVYDRDGARIHVSKYGDFIDPFGDLSHISEFVPPFTAVEPEKTNEDYAKELLDIENSLLQTKDVDTTCKSMYQRLLEIMDEKIKKAKL